jgi:hypothetical protein
MPSWNEEPKPSSWENYPQAGVNQERAKELEPGVTNRTKGLSEAFRKNVYEKLMEKFGKKGKSRQVADY